MAASVADLFVVLDSVTDPFSKGLKKAAADAESESKRMSGALGAVAKVGVGLAVGVAGIGVASIKAASDFQSTMTKLYTAAGAPKAAVEAATGAVLQMGTAVGMTGTQMAEALYHPVSAGLDMATSLQVVKYAAEEAQISGANLDDTTYSLSSVMKAFNYPATQAAQTMAQLNAIVGDGDMRFQDFNQSIKNWAPTAAQMGISVTSMGAGLAYLTDRGNSAEVASTRLTMGISMMTTPTKQAAALLEGLGVASSDVKASSAAMTDILKSTGITQNQLAADLAKPDGLYVALNHLKTALDAAGIHGTEADSVLSKLFGGGRSDKAIMSLLQNLDGLKQKYDQISSDSTTKKFESNWEGVKQTFAFQIQQMKAGVENFGIELGTKALPYLSSFISTAEKDLGSFFSQFSSGFSGADLKAPKVPNMGHAGLNQIAMHLSEPQTAFERFGQTVHTVLMEVESDAKRLEPVGRDFVTFGVDVWQAGVKLLTALEPTAKLLGGALLLGIEGAGKAAANILGPAIKDFANFLASHQELVRVFSEVILGGLIVKMTILGTLNAAEGIVKLATAIVSFPLGQAGQIGDALKAVKTAYTGKEAADGEQAVKGLAGAFTDLKQAGSNVLDKVLPDSNKLANLSKLGTDATTLESAAAGAGRSLPSMATAISEVEQAAVTAESASSGLTGKLGKFAIAGAWITGIVGGAALLGTWLGHLAGVGDHTAMDMQKLSDALSLVASGSTSASAQLAQAGAEQALVSGFAGKSLQGLQQVDQGLAQLVTSGHADEAKSEFAQIQQRLVQLGGSAQQAVSQFPQFEQALKDAGDAAKTMDGQVQSLETTLNQQQAVTQFNSDLQMVSQTLQANKGSLTGNSQAAIANQQAMQQASSDILNFYQQQRNAGVGIAAATTQMDQQITALERTAVKSGIAKADVDKYIETLFNIPASRLTQILADTSPALNSVNKLIAHINGSSASITVYENSSGTVITPSGGGMKARAGGGPVTAGNTYLVGEDGPEIVTFGASGYVTPNSMLQPAALAGPRSSGFGGGGSGGGTTNYYFITNVAGSVLSDKKLTDLVRTTVLQFNGRNSVNGLSLP